ncbi:MAG TPA: efflux RND transporter periplasmic adaptor subunit [Burkholderiales bacterium]|nr:efflux RND transporter periplasmic adaptor subunit [Burkholderiales bacterium]
MKARNWVLSILLATGLVIGGYGVYRLGFNDGAENTALSGASASPPDKKVLYWHDPMVPGHKFDKPGKSPFMDMQLVPVYADEGGDDGGVTISPRVQQNLGIRTAETTRRSVAPLVQAVGNVAYNERDIAVVQARSNGFIDKLHVRATLDSVRKGQPLAELYVPEWVAVQEEYLSARRLSGARFEGLLDGARQRMRLAGMTDDQIKLVESTGKVHSRLTVRAPIDGVVTELGAREGMTTMAGALLFRINGVATVWVNAEVPEGVAAQVRPGAVVEARAAALPGTVFKGRVGAILPEVDAATRTIKARVELINADGQLTPGMFATVSFTAASPKEAVLAPTEAIIQTGSRSVVIVAEGGKFKPVDVETGVDMDGHTEIRKGLAAGQTVVVSGQFLIDSEASLKGAIGRLSGSAEKP